MIAATMTDQDARFAIRLAEFDQMRPGYVTKFRALRDRLLALGGACVVVMPEEDVFLDLLLADGALLLSSRIVMTHGGAPNACHRNAAELFRAGRGLVAAGYGLSEDGLWRRHFWIVDRKRGRILETTVRRCAYFGIVLPAFASARFAEALLGRAWRRPTDGTSPATSPARTPGNPTPRRTEGSGLSARPAPTSAHRGAPGWAWRRVHRPGAAPLVEVRCPRCALKPHQGPPRASRTRAAPTCATSAGGATVCLASRVRLSHRALTRRSRPDRPASRHA